MNFQWGTGTTAALLNQLIANVNGRTNKFNFSSNTNQYAFGNDKGSIGNYFITLIQDSLKITHDCFNQFSFSLSTEYVSGP
jgi:hypothetical protein